MSLSVTMLPFSRATDVGCGSFGVGRAVIRQRFSDGGSGGGSGRGLGGGGCIYSSAPFGTGGGRKSFFLCSVPNGQRCSAWRMGVSCFDLGSPRNGGGDGGGEGHVVARGQNEVRRCPMALPNGDGHPCHPLLPGGSQPVAFANVAEQQTVESFVR